MIFPGFQVSGPVSMVIPIDQSSPVRFKGYRPLSLGRGASWEMDFYGAFTFFQFSLGELQRPEFFSLACLGAGSPAANRQSKAAWARMPKAGCRGGEGGNWVALARLRKC